MAKKIIVLERLKDELSFRCAFWLIVPSSRTAFFVNTEAGSAYINASSAEITAIRTGSVVEKVFISHYSSGTSVATIQTDLVNKYNDDQNELTSFNAFVHYGRFHDGTGWTAGGVG